MVTIKKGHNNDHNSLPHYVLTITLLKHHPEEHSLVNWGNLFFLNNPECHHYFQNPFVMMNRSGTIKQMSQRCTF